MESTRHQDTRAVTPSWVRELILAERSNAVHRGEGLDGLNGFGEMNSVVKSARLKNLALLDRLHHAASGKHGAAIHDVFLRVANAAC